jgi:branched-subunit amino acid aminotransferase/4-amino-4-deoxychorismate lyase
MIVFLNGEFLPAERAAVPIDDPGFAFGEGIYETVALRSGRPSFWEDHWSRLCASADALGIEVPLTFAEATRVLRELVRRNDLADAMARFQLTGSGPAAARGSPLDGRRAGRACPPRTLLVQLATLPLYPAEEVLRGWKIVLSSLPTAPFLPRVKHTNRLPHVLARREALRASAQEAILLDTRGVLLEGTRSNLFFFRDEVLYTPAVECGILPGVTREKVLLLARREGLTVNEGLHLPSELAEAAEVFLTFTSAGIMPVTDVDGRPVGAGRMGPATGHLRSEYGRLLSTALARVPALV